MLTYQKVNAAQSGLRPHRELCNAVQINGNHSLIPRKAGNLVDYTEKFDFTHIFKSQ